MLVPFVLPTVVVATAFLALLPDGYERGLWAILAAHVFFNVAVVTRIVGGAWATIDPRSAEAAAVLGAGPLRRVREVTLPQLAPALSAASALTFLFCFTSFGVILILGGPGRATVETEIYNRAARLFDLQAAAALSLLQLGAVAARAHRREHPRGARRRAGDARRRERRAPPPDRTRARRALRRARGGRARARLPPRPPREPGSLGSWGTLFEETPALLVEPWRAAVFSIAFAGVAAAIALVVGGLAAIALARRPPGVVDGLVLLPLGASAVMLGFGFLIAFDEAPVDFRSSWWLVPVAQSLVAAPFVVRIVTPAVRSIDPALREVAATLGASPARSLAGDRRATRRPGLCRRGGIRIRHRARRVRRHGLRGAGGAADAARRDLSLPRAARGGEPGTRRGAGGRAGGDRRVRGARRGAGRRRPRAGSLMPPALEVVAARVTLGGHPALAGADLEVESGATIAVLGPSGSGKSTLLRAIAGLQRLDEGSVALDGRSLDGRAPAPARRRPDVPGRRALSAP